MPAAIVTLFDELYRAATGRAPEPGSGERVAAELEANGLAPHDPPPYFLEGLAALAQRHTTAWRAVDEGDRGMAWILANLATLVPTAWSEDSKAATVLGVAALERALVVEHPGGDERWAVLERRPPDAPRSSGTRVLGTFGPTMDQARAWARDADLRFTEQDEELALASPAYVDLMLELLDDPATLPRKRAVVLTALGEVARQRSLAGDAGAATYIAELAAKLARASGEDARALGATLSARS